MVPVVAMVGGCNWLCIMPDEGFGFNTLKPSAFGISGG
jgi:hypothetical protein